MKSWAKAIDRSEGKNDKVNLAGERWVAAGNN